MDLLKGGGHPGEEVLAELSTVPQMRLLHHLSQKYQVFKIFCALNS